MSSIQLDTNESALESYLSLLDSSEKEAVLRRVRQYEISDSDPIWEIVLASRKKDENLKKSIFIYKVLTIFIFILSFWVAWEVHANRTAATDLAHALKGTDFKDFVSELMTQRESIEITRQMQIVSFYDQILRNQQTKIDREIQILRTSHEKNGTLSTQQRDRLTELGNLQKNLDEDLKRQSVNREKVFKRIQNYDNNKK